MKPSALKVTLLILLVLCAAYLPGRAEAVTYNLTQDFDDTHNPDGPWTYRVGNYTLPGANNWGNSGLHAWAYSATAGTSGFIPAVIKQDGVVMVHGNDFSGNGTWGLGIYGEANVIWTAPQAGIYQVSGILWQINRTDGRNMDWFLYQGATELDSGNVAWNDGHGQANPYHFEEEVTLGSGGVIMFQTSMGEGSPYATFVGLDMTVSSVPLPAGVWLMGSGLLGLLGLARRRRN